jgi:hypothetical protein
MLAMWHRVMTRPWYGLDGAAALNLAADEIRAMVGSATTHLVADIVSEYCDSKTFSPIRSVGCCRPTSETAWVEVSKRPGSIQCGWLFQEYPKDDGIDLAIVVFGEYRGDVGLAGRVIVSLDADGLINRIQSSDDNVLSATLTPLQAFAFANCRNVETVNCDNHAPDGKFCRRQKVPSVIYRTLKIPGFQKRYIGGDGADSEANRRLHICRGHFATYTAEKPLFGRPDGVGKFWHPAHVRGNKESGEVVKDYVVAPVQVG